MPLGFEVQGLFSAMLTSSEPVPVGGRRLDTGLHVTTHATMSLSSTSTLKGQLTTNLGTKAPLYFDTLKDFVSGRISRQEFDDAVHQVLDSNSLSTSLR